jgi:hypothetical protein
MNSLIEIKQYFTDEELDYFLPLLKLWCRNELEIVNWFNTHQIPACSNKTPDELCKEMGKDLFIQYVKHIKLEGFS